MLDLILSARGVSNSCLRLSSLPPKYRFCVDSMGWEENRSQHSLALKLIFQDYRSGYKSNGEVNQFPQGKNSNSLRYHQEARPRFHLTSAAPGVQVGSDEALRKTSSRPQPAGRMVQEAEHLPPEDTGTGSPAAAGQHCRPPALVQEKRLEMSSQAQGSGTRQSEEVQPDHASPRHGQGELGGSHSVRFAERPRETPSAVSDGGA